MVTERSVVSVQPRSATMSEPDSGRCFRFGFRTQKLFVERGVGGCVILLVRQDQIFAAQRAQWRRAAGGGRRWCRCRVRVGVPVYDGSAAERREIEDLAARLGWDG